MSIVKMRHMKVVASSDERKKLFYNLVKLGCVEITPPDKILKEEDLDTLVTRGSGNPEIEDKIRDVGSAMKILKEIAKPKKGFLDPRQQISEDDFLRASELDTACLLAQKLKSLREKIREDESAVAALEARIEQYTPWMSLNVPLEWSGTKHTSAVFGTLPVHTEVNDVIERFETEAPEAEIEVVSQDKTRTRIFVVMHEDMEETAMNILKSVGFSRVTFDEKGTPKEIEERLSAEKQVLLDEIAQLKDEVVQRGDKMPLLERAYDMLVQKKLDSQEESNLLHTKRAVYFEGWTPARNEKDVTQILEKFGCAYEFEDPKEGDDIPIKLQNSQLVEPLSVVTEMYQLPTYDGIDPNPFIFFFFCFFFGMMYADMGYGLILIALGLFGTYKLKPKGRTMSLMMRLVVLVGVWTLIWGAMFGGFFGDVITTVSTQFGNPITVPALLLNPLEQPMMLLYLSIGFGIVHILFGMGISAYMSIRDGKPLDALFDVGSWWLLFAGLVVIALGGTPWVAIAGVAALVLTQGRNSPTIIGKIMGGVSSLYNVTSYLSDVLSYLRLMALVLATSVIASVINTLGIMTGAIGFVIIFIFGHAFNMGINIIGTYVHAARLQYLEFFNKFYKAGGRAFEPYQINTKYVDVVKEENVNGILTK